MVERRRQSQTHLPGLRPPPAARRARDHVRDPRRRRGRRLRALQAACGGGGLDASARRPSAGRRRRPRAPAPARPGARRPAVAASRPGTASPARRRRAEVQRRRPARASARAGRLPTTSQRTERGSARAARSAPRSTATLRARPSPEALAAFNASNHRRTVAGLTRTLGPPRASALAVRASNGTAGRAPDRRLGAHLVPVGGRAGPGRPGGARVAARGRRSTSCARPIAPGTCSSAPTARSSSARWHRSADAGEGAAVRLTVHVDGGARGNPGPAAIAAVITDADGEVIHEATRRSAARPTTSPSTGR